MKASPGSASASAARLALIRPRMRSSSSRHIAASAGKEWVHSILPSQKTASSFDWDVNKDIDSIMGTLMEAPSEGVRREIHQALAQGKGVCQDHAHVFVSAARTLGIPARYVAGYLLADEGGQALRGV